MLDVFWCHIFVCTDVWHHFLFTVSDIFHFHSIPANPFGLGPRVLMGPVKYDQVFRPSPVCRNGWQSEKRLSTATHTSHTMNLHCYPLPKRHQRPWKILIYLMPEGLQVSRQSSSASRLIPDPEVIEVSDAGGRMRHSLFPFLPLHRGSFVEQVRTAEKVGQVVTPAGTLGDVQSGASVLSFRCLWSWSWCFCFGNVDFQRRVFLFSGI